MSPFVRNRNWMQLQFAGSIVACFCAAVGICVAAEAQWDTFADTWAACDALNRRVPMFAETGPPRANRFVGVFYFLWLGPHARGGPYDVTKILAKDPAAMQKPDSPLWGPLYAAHHWGESMFGYYQTDDPYVLRKHAQMLADAGVDAIIFDVTNQYTYRSNYMALLREFDAVRRLGGRTPQVAFLCPFWEPARVVNELFQDLYQPNLYPHLWFQWDGKPLILADASKIGRIEIYAQHDTPVKLAPGHTWGQSFTNSAFLEGVEGCFPTWGTRDSALTLTLKRDGPAGEVLARQRFENVADNAWLGPKLPKPLPPGRYYLEASEPKGTIGWWGLQDKPLPAGAAYVDGQPVSGSRNLRLNHQDPRKEQILKFFTFRKPQPDYFQGPTGPDMWSWLEVYPQHVFYNSRGEKEQMSVGVAQNAVGRRCGSMSEPGARGRSFHDGATDTAPDAVLKGLNFAEQFEHALRNDPRFIFITGWNEWIAGLHHEFAGVKLPVMFVDEFDQEHSRDIEPMRGGHGDNYYYQMVSYIRRYKGVRPPPLVRPPCTILITEDFSQWANVLPEYRDDRGDNVNRDFPGYNNFTRYTNFSARNDLVLGKVARDNRFVYFYLQAASALRPANILEGLHLLVDIDQDYRTGWEGYDLIINRAPAENGLMTVEKNSGGWNWKPVGTAKYFARDARLHLAIPREIFGQGRRLHFDFKWTDNVPLKDGIMTLYTHGDTAPNARFNYRFDEPQLQ